MEHAECPMKWQYTAITAVRAAAHKHAVHLALLLQRCILTRYSCSRSASGEYYTLYNSTSNKERIL
eukprot:7718-Heterococcus_DN1.PRE.1